MSRVAACRAAGRVGLWSLICLMVALGVARAQQPIEYRVLATSKTSTMEKELNAGAEQGFRYNAVMGGETEFGGKEVVTVMSRSGGREGRFAYRLLATNRTSTMEKEIQGAAKDGYEYKGQTILETVFGGQEVVVIMERDKDAQGLSEYRLVATTRTSTLEKELRDDGQVGYNVVGMTVGKTALGGKELVAIMKRPKS